MAEMFPPRRDEPLVNDFGVPTLRFAEYLEAIARTVTSAGVESDANSSSSPEFGILNGSIQTLKERIDDFEASNDSDVLNGKITAISAKVNRLIEELIDAVNNLSTVEADNKALIAQQATTSELQLLNARFEETFETDIEERDV